MEKPRLGLREFIIKSILPVTNIMVINARNVLVATEYSEIVKNYKTFYRYFNTHSSNVSDQQNVSLYLPRSYKAFRQVEQFQITTTKNSLDAKQRVLNERNIKEYVYLVLSMIMYEKNNLMQFLYYEQNSEKIHMFERDIFYKREVKADFLTSYAFHHGSNSMDIEKQLPLVREWQDEEERNVLQYVIQYWDFLANNGEQICNLIGSDAYAHKLSRFDPRFVKLMEGGNAFEDTIPASVEDEINDYLHNGNIKVNEFSR